MQITLDIPDGVAKALHEFVGPDIGRAAIERFALEGYKAGKLTPFQVRQLLGLDNRWDTEEWLGRHGADLGWTQEDLETEWKSVEHLLSGR